MAWIKNYEQFIQDVADRDFKRYFKRFQELAGIRPIDESKKPSYYVQITFNFDNALLEGEYYKFFQKTNNRYCFHPEDKNIPVKAHYHIVPSNSTKEIYAVNTDGTAHHKKNRGIQVPKKEANELRSMGVNIPDSNIIECVDDFTGGELSLLTESVNKNNFCIFIQFDEE